jgi:PAS domain S-box-containing protein
MGYGNRREALSADEVNQLGQEITELNRTKQNLQKTINNLKESEEFYKSITQNSTDITIIVNKTGQITYVNPAIEYFMGYKPEELIGRSAFDFISKTDLPRAIYDFGKAVLTRDAVIANSFGVKHKNGSIRILEGVGKTMFDNPSVKGFVMNVRDITERKKAEEELESYHKHLKRLVEERTAELENINQELRLQLSERYRAEEALRESESRYQSILENTGTGMLIVEEDMTISLVNAEWEKITGYTRQEIEGKRKWIEFVHKSDLESMIQQHRLRRTDKNLAKKSYEFRLVPKDGGLKNVYLTVDIIRGTLKSVASLMDITEHKKAEEDRIEREQMIKSILSTTPVGIGLTADRKIKWVNEAWMQMFGFEDEKACINLPVASLYSSGESYEESRRRIYTILENAGIASIEAFMIRQDGNPFPAQINVKPLDRSDLKKGVISTIVDISEWKRLEQSLRESEERYRLAMEATSDGLWDWDIPSGTVSYSPAWYKILGETIENHFSCWGSRLHPDDKDSVLQSLRDHLEGKNENWSHEHRVKTESGKWKWVLGRGSVIARDTDEKPLRMVGTIIDIDERKNLEHQLVQAQKMEAIGTLAGGIAHDFNNILGSISGYTELSLLKNRSQECRENYLQNVLKACDRAKNLVNQILLFSRQREGEKKPVDVTLIVKEALKLLRASLPSTIKINLNVPVEAFLVIADPTHIHQIIMNLCTNAAHAMRDNGGVLEVTFSRFLSSGKTQLINPGFKIGPYMHMQVTDTGHGIDPSILDKIFDPFFTTKKQGEGTGLGLSVVYGIIKSYDGIINVESKLGRGSTFDIYLPCVDVENHQAEKERTDVCLKGSERILVIDDEEDLVTVMEKYLSSLGYQVTTSISSPEALEIFRDRPHRFDLVITDMTMPQMTGLKLSQEIHATRPDIPIILNTGYEVSISEAEAKINGIREFVMKPIRFNEFSVIIRNVLDKQFSK